MEGMIFLENYLEKELFMVEDDQSKNDFAKKINVNANNIVSDNEQLEKGDIVLVNYKKSFIYIVKPIDTLESISKKFGKSVEEIKRKNNIRAIFIGQQLDI